MTVTALVPNIDKDLYCYETTLDFGKDVAKDILQSVLDDESQFPKRKNYNPGTDPKELTKLIGAKKTRELIRRQIQIKDNYQGQNKIDFKQYYFTDYYSEQLRSTVPDFILDIDAEGAVPILQVSENGDFLPAHKGHKRKCSLMMLIQEDQQETRWYRNKEDFEVIDPLRIPDLDKVEAVVSVIMKPFVWYMFNHFEWHSVHKFEIGAKRISIGLDFNSINGEELVNIIKNQGY